MPWWWPAILVPEGEVDETMPVAPAGLRVARFFQDNSYAVVDPDETLPFKPGTSPFTEFADGLPWPRPPILMRFVRVPSETRHWAVEGAEEEGSLVDSSSSSTSSGESLSAGNSGTGFLQSRGVKRALQYLKSGVAPGGFRWRLWIQVV